MKKPKGQHHNEDLKSVQRWEVLAEDDSDASFLEGIADAGIIIRNMPLVQRKQKCLCVWMEGMWLRSRKGRECGCAQGKEAGSARSLLRYIFSELKGLFRLGPNVRTIRRLKQSNP